MIYNIGVTPSIAHTFLAFLRDKNQHHRRPQFRDSVLRLGEIMAVEISKTLPFTPITITTPLATASGFALQENPVLVTVLRAGLPYWEGFRKMFQDSDSGFIGAYRKEGKEVSIVFDYSALPDLTNRTVILIDPMLATGKSIVECVEHIKAKSNPKKIILACLIAAPEGIQNLERTLGNDFPIWTFAVDEKLNEHAYIVPGLGDAGDLSFGEKL